MNTFTKARFKLTLFYILITAILLGLATVSAINSEKRAFAGIQEALADRVERPKLTALLERRLSEFEQRFTRRLIILDLALLGVASAGAYFLSGLTLKPIQEMLKEQEEFAADASHELRTPLTTIATEIEAVKRSRKRLPEEVKTLFASIEEEILRMKGIVDGLLTIVRGKSAEESKDWKVLNFSSLVINCFSQMKSTASEKKIKFRLENEPNLKVRGSEEQLKQAVLIFIDNAIKYTPAYESVSVKLSPRGSKVVLEISDTGHGISKSDLPHIFERFYRGTASESSAYRGESSTAKGSGLGLAIAKKILSAHQAKISVESKVSKGSKFSLLFPRYS